MGGGGRAGGGEGRQLPVEDRVPLTMPVIAMPASPRTRAIASRVVRTPTRRCQRSKQLAKSREAGTWLLLGVSAEQRLGHARGASSELDAHDAGILTIEVLARAAGREDANLVRAEPSGSSSRMPRSRGSDPAATRGPAAPLTPDRSTTAATRSSIRGSQASRLRSVSTRGNGAAASSCSLTTLA